MKKSPKVPEIIGTFLVGKVIVLGFYRRLLNRSNLLNERIISRHRR